MVMEEDTDSKIKKFETFLKGYSVSKPLLYSNKIIANATDSPKSIDVITNISKQIKDLSKNETLNKNTNRKIKAYKESRLTSIKTLFLEPKQRRVVTNGFDNQYVNDTQLLLATKDVEAINLGSGITQEFETTFDQNPDTHMTSDRVDCCIDNKVYSSHGLTIHKIDNSYNKHNSVNNELLHLVNEKDKNVDVCIIQKFKSDCNTEPLSPILLSNKSKYDCNTSFLLEAFEKFEAVAIPIVHENSDIEIIKKIINHQMSHETKQHTPDSGRYDDKAYETESIHLSPVLKLKTVQEEVNSGNDKFIEEEILFSSDEEINHNCNEVGELPLTCALETSFYKQEHILDETIYVGFQTASNKSIQVLTDSFSKAKSILLQNDPNYIKQSINTLSFTELVEVYDNASAENIASDDQLKEINDMTQYPSNFKSGASSEGTGKSCNKENQICGTDYLDKKLFHERNMSRLCTQNQIKIDDYMMQEFEENLCIDDNKLHTNLSIASQSVAINDILLLKSDNNRDAHLDQNKLHIEKKQLENSYIDTSRITEKISYDKDNKINQRFTGFKTASNKCIDISRRALEKSKKILDEACIQSNVFEIVDVTNVNDGLFQEHKKASCNLINNCDEIYAQSNNTFRDIELPSLTSSKSLDDQQQLFNVKGNVGFKTASNMPIYVSKNALLKSIKLLQEIDCDDDIVIINKNEKVNEKRNIANTLKFQTELCKVSTATKHKLNIKAETAFKRSKHDYKNNKSNQKSLKDFQEILSITKTCPGIDSSAKCKRMLDINVSEKSENNIGNEEPLFFTGFTTASNKPVNISRDALIKSKNIIDNMLCDQELDFKESHGTLKMESKELISSKNYFHGFKTDSNNPVKPSDEILKHCNTIVSHISKFNNYGLDTLNPIYEVFNEPTCEKNMFQGFKTASNNPLKVSDEALEKSKNFFQYINNYNSEINYAQEGEFKRIACSSNAFQGFKTASNTLVKISDEALERGNKLFQDIDINKNDFDNQSLHMNTTKNINLNVVDLKTGYNNHVIISQEALRKSKNLLEGVDDNLKTKIKQKLNHNVVFGQIAPVTTTINVNKREMNVLETKETIKNTSTESYDVSKLMNTEVIKNFDVTISTEDFLSKSPRSKRSGSPILSCPKAKKIKVKYAKQNESEKDVRPVEELNRYMFNANYKKYKKYKLLDVYKMDKVSDTVRHSQTEVNYNIDNISNFEFDGARNELSDHKWTAVNIKNRFIELVNKNIIPDGWIDNHIKLITLKLTSYEKRFPNSMHNVCSVANVIEQLKYRYERELYNVERPSLRKILEKDEIPSRRIVLQVLGIYKKGVSTTNACDSSENIELLLSDYWYCVKASLDKMLTKLVCDRKIDVGTKLVTHGAELVNCDQGVAPWEDTSLVRLKIFGNCTRRAHWTARLGFHGNGAILSYLTSIKPEGGKISQLKVVVTRVYPMLYVEKFDDGSTVTRSERLENLYQMKYEMEKEKILEKIYEEVENEFCIQASQCDDEDEDRKSLESGSQIYQLLKKSRDPADFRASLTHSQSKILQDYIDRRREMSLLDLQSKVQSVIKKRGLSVTRNVVAMMKLRVADVYKQNVTKAMINVWRPHESLQQILQEGTWLDVHNVVPTAVRYSEIQISAGRQSLFRKTSKVDSRMEEVARTFQRKCYLIQELTQNPYLTTDHNEVDTVGFVFDIEPSVDEFDSKKQLFQNVYLADVNKKIICVNFWGGLKKFGFENILEIEQIVACVNLQKRSGNTRKTVPQYRATEFTYFTRIPKIHACREVCEDLSKQFLSLDRRKFIQDCKILRNNLINIKYRNVENISPYRFNNSDYNLSKNKIFINSLNGDPNLNLNGLDFDSTFKQSDTVLSPKTLLRKKEISERIAKLQKIGEPPPLSSIYMVNKSKGAVKPYISPLLSKLEPNDVRAKSNKGNAVVLQTATNSTVDHPDEKSSNKCTSPVLPYKRRSVNPVILNFSEQNDVPKVDPFSEDFETSPPLSLD